MTDMLYFSEPKYVGCIPERKDLLCVKNIIESDVVLDVGGAMKPFDRADYVIDILPFEKREKTEEKNPRYTANTWIQRDICNKEPWPFRNKQFDFVFCGNVLEDIRDPIWVCQEMMRVGKQGHIQIPSISLELSNVEGRYKGFYHHRWLVLNLVNKLEFLYKSTALLETEFQTSKCKGSKEFSNFYWNDSFEVEERIFHSRAELVSFYKPFFE
jgi:ubiquinone/menaquinone biosynthesis C-methylase UbiE